MAMNLRNQKWLRRIGSGIIAALSFLYLAACLIPFLDPGTFWFIAALGLVFPVLALLMLLIVIYMAVRRSRLFFLAVIIFMAGWQQLAVMVGFNFFANQKGAGANADFSVLTWNVNRWDEQNRKLKGGVSFRELMLDAINSQQADILCFQEFFEPYGNGLGEFQSNIRALAAMGYPYAVFFPSSVIYTGERKFGLFICSRYPITDSGMYRFANTPHSEGVMYADIRVKEQVVRVFNVGLESFRGSEDGVDGIEHAGGLKKTKHIFTGLKRSYSHRAEQARQVSRLLKESPYPVILAGKLADVPNSYTYFKVRNGMKDVFLERGSGLGSTLDVFPPVFRMDYILSDKRFRILRYQRPVWGYSDHRPIIAEFSLNK
ncbi:MAG TPA: hypothetical protein PKC69_10375 [Chitinophagaceae bacterium]|nr:hypothetical protein [Chitinophagaceae bacterium]